MRNHKIAMYSLRPFRLNTSEQGISCHRRLYRFFTIACVLMLVTSCTTTSNKGDPDILDGINLLKPPPSSWQINAKLGIRSPQRNGSVTLNWQQLGDHFTIKVQGPLGQGSAIISGTQYNAELKQPGKPAVQSNNVDALVFNTFGWTLPLDNLIHWVRATANPKQAITAINYDPILNTLSLLEQSGWALNYSRYKPVETWALPGRIRAIHKDVAGEETTLTLIIRKWTIL